MANFSVIIEGANPIFRRIQGLILLRICFPGCIPGPIPVLIFSTKWIIMSKHLCSVILSLFLFISGTAVAQPGTGLVFDDREYSSQPSLPRSMKFTSAELPQAASLKKYSPVPGHQGSMSSCVGWASAYGAISISAAIRGGITDKGKITEMARSALYIYNQIKIGGCDGGSRIPDAMELLKEKGTPKLTDFNPPNCLDLPDYTIHEKAKSMMINEYNKIFDPSDNPDFKISNTRNSIAANKPVVIGMKITKSFFNVGPEGHWTPSEIDADAGGHAMCVVGYDDFNKRFEILNSWGTDYGKGGFVTVSYDDYAKFCKYAFQFNLKDNNPSTVFNFQSSFRINKVTGFDSEKGVLQFQNLDISRSGMYYTVPPGSIRKGDFFKVLASGMNKDNYLYIFSAKPDGSAELLYPSADPSSFSSTVAVIPLIPTNNSYVEIPADSAKGMRADLSGTDYLVYIYSSRLIEGFETLMQQVMQTEGDMYSRLRRVFGDRMVPESSVNYYINGMGFSGSASTGHAVPLILKVDVID
jgi:hypothetical protein